MNNWNQPPQQPQQPQQPPGNQQAGNNGALRTGSLLRDYQRQQSQPPPQYNQQSPFAPSSQVPNPYSPFPPTPGQNENGQATNNRSGLLSQHQQGQNSPPAWPQAQGWVSNTFQMMQQISGKMAAMPMIQQLSGKMAAIARNHAPVPPPRVAPHLAVYRPQIPSQPGISGPLGEEEKRKPWRRSRAVRAAWTKRHRRINGKGANPRFARIAMGVAIAFLTFIIVALGSGAAYAYSFYQQQLPKLGDIADMRIAQMTRIYDRNGVLLFNSYNTDPEKGEPGRRIPISYDDIPPVLRDALTATEDRTFWDNSGVDPQGIARAATLYLQHQNQVQGGGSTLTQQLIKNLTGDTAVTPDRKLTEAALAIGMTQQFPKAKIMEMYFNVAPFGAQELGVEAAVEDFFGLQRQCDNNFKCAPAIRQLAYDPTTKKNDPYLELARASLLAGLPQNPTQFDPTTNKDHTGLLARQDQVLNSMMQVGTSVDGIGQITPDVIKKVEDMTAKMKFKQYNYIKNAPHFVDWVVHQMELTLGNGDAGLGHVRFTNGGFNIRTTIDANLEKYVEQTVNRRLTQPDYQIYPYPHYATLNTQLNVNTAAAVVMNAKTGEILAMNGSLDYNNSNIKVAGQINLATGSTQTVTSPDGKKVLGRVDGIGRQPGSTFKPFVYAAAIEMGWYPGVVLPDSLTWFPNGMPAGTQVSSDPKKQDPYHPTDYGGHYNNQTFSMRLSLANSFNVPAVKAMTFVGLDNAMNMAQRLGLGPSLDADMKLKMLRGDCVQPIPAQCLGNNSFVLGTNNIPVLQMTGAYQAFANQGVRVQPQGILDVWDNYGNHLYHFDAAKVQKIQAMSAQTAYMMTSMLADEHARSFEFPGDHDLSFYDWDPTCVIPQAPKPDCLNHQVAAKTGTSEDFKDNWTIGYTPNVVVGVWAGNANGDPLGDGVVGITGAAPIWHSIIELAAGGCNQDRDGIPCPKLDLKALNLDGPGVFTQPDGLEIACTSTTNGLQVGFQNGNGGNNGGNGNGGNGGNNNGTNNSMFQSNNTNAAAAGCNNDWVLAGMRPMQPGVDVISSGNGGGGGKKHPGPGNGGGGNGGGGNGNGNGNGN